jgi:hypothetical protein
MGAKTNTAFGQGGWVGQAISVLAPFTIFLGVGMNTYLQNSEDHRYYFGRWNSSAKVPPLLRHPPAFFMR